MVSYSAEQPARRPRSQEKRLRKDVFKGPIVANVFADVAGAGPAFPDRVYDNIDVLGAAYRAGQHALGAFERGMRREQEEVAKMIVFKGRGFVMLSRRKMVWTVAEMEKAAVERVKKSKGLEGEVRNLQRALGVRSELEEMTDEWYDAHESL